MTEYLKAIFTWIAWLGPAALFGLVILAIALPTLIPHFSVA